MEEGKALPSTSGGGGDSSRPPSSFVKVGDRQMFTVELRPGETTIVSWKKLIKDANKARGSNSVPELSAASRPSLEVGISPEVKPDEGEVQDAAHPNRFSAVIEKIERLYMGKDSSDEEDLLDVPDDDQYDTEDSFIDDAELDEYFKVDNSAIKHDGFFVNRGDLERLNENLELPIQQPKKRRRKESGKNNRENGDGHGSLDKYLKATKPDASKTLSLSVKNSFNPSQNVAKPSEGDGQPKSHDQLIISGIRSRKKSTETKETIDPSASMKTTNGASVFEMEVKDADRQQGGVIHSKNVNEKIRDISGSFDVSHRKYQEKSTSKSHTGRPSNNVGGLENKKNLEGINVKYELPDLNLMDGKSVIQATKSPYTQRKDGSSVKSKSSLLDKAIRELEKMVAESRPPAGENQEADTAQAVKRRLPREIKLKLAKVARLAASHGKVSKDLINRLMSILGHLVQLRTLKRNLKVMISMGLSAKQETDDRFQRVKKEVVEMIKMQVPSLESMAIRRQAGMFDDFQEFGSDERGYSTRKFSIDAALEDKICELYDLFVDGLDENVAPQVRKLYVELAQLWPNNTMDNHGIKRAIIRAKERRGAMHRRHKDHVKLKRKKMLGPGQEGSVRVEPSSVGQHQYMREKLTPEFGYHGVPSANKLDSNMTSIDVKVPSSIVAVYKDRAKQDKVKRHTGNYGEDGRVIDGTLMKKKVKRKPELDKGRSHFRPEKLLSQGEERPKPLQQTAPVKSKSSATTSFAS